MGQPRLKWGQLERYLLRHGYDIRPQGGDKVIVAPKSTERGTRNTLRIGHTSCSSAGAELLKVYVSKLRNVFKITIEDTTRNLVNCGTLTTN